jgi:hypothetical protein
MTYLRERDFLKKHFWQKKQKTRLGLAALVNKTPKKLSNQKLAPADLTSPKPGQGQGDPATC